MRLFVFTITVVVNFFHFCLAAEATGKKPLALVYSGPGACSIKDGDCISAAAQVAVRAGLHVKHVTQETLRASDFNRAVVWIQPGGDAIETATHLNGLQKDWIKGFIRQGGAYLGFCAGAFFADTWVDDDNSIPGLAILPGVSFDLTKDQTPMMIYVLWEGVLRSLYFQAGPYFKVEPRSAKVVAKYLDSKPAVVYTHFGFGKVALSGPHPEAPQSWIDEDGLRDEDGTDEDLSDKMIDWLLRPDALHR